MNQVTLKFLRFHCLDRHHCAVQYHQLIDGIINRFEKAHPHIKIESMIMRNWYQLMYTLNKKLPAEDGPDVFHTCGGGELEDLVQKGLVHDLSAWLDNGWRESFVTATFEPIRFDGREYALPLEQGYIFVWYNKSIFERHGFTIPTTFDELLVLCRELRRHGIIPFTVGNRERWPGAFFFSHLFHRIGGEEVFVSDFTQEPNYTDIRKAFIGAAEKLLELVAAGAFHEDCDYTNYQQQRDMFVREEAAMQLNGNRLLSYLMIEGPSMLDRIGVFPFPLITAGKGKTSTVFGGSLATYGISARSHHKEEAQAFLRCLTDEHAARDVIFGMGDIPAMKYVPSSEYPSPLHGGLAESLGKAQKIQVHFFKYLPPHAAGVYLNVVAKLFTRNISPQDAFKTVEEALSKAPANNINDQRGYPDEI
jgi:raffinose/stachyose/melibiose transport system substrate-binding protein